MINLHVCLDQSVKIKPTINKYNFILNAMFPIQGAISQSLSVKLAYSLISTIGNILLYYKYIILKERGKKSKRKTEISSCMS